MRSGRITIFITITLIMPVWSTSQSSAEFNAKTLLQKAQDGNILSDSARIAYEALLEHTRLTQLKHYEADAHYALGKHYLLRSQLPQARSHFYHAWQIFEETGDIDNAGFALERLGVSYQKMDLLDSALMCFNLVIELYTRHAMPHKMWNPFMGLSTVHQKLGNHAEALSFSKAAWETAEKHQDRATKVIVLVHLMKLAFSIDSLDLYTRSADQMLQLYSPIEIDQASIHHVHNFLAVRDPAKRIEAIHSFIDRIAMLPPTLEHVFTYYALGETYAQLGRWQQAIETWNRAYTLEKEEVGLLSYRLLLLRTLSNGYERVGDFQNALSAYRSYTVLRDSLAQQQNQEKIDELRVQYETRAKDLEIAAQRTQLSRKTAERNVTFLGAGVLLLAIGYVVYNQRQRLRDQKTIAVQAEMLHQREIDELKTTHALSTLQTLVTSQEDERRRIAQDLHDGLGGLLATVRIRANQLLRKQDGVATIGEMCELVGLLDGLGAEVRKIAHNMMPHALIRMGLVPALEDLANTLQSGSAIQVAFQSINCDEPLAQDKEIALYRIAQELCTNAIKHAQAQNLLIQLSRHNGTATLVVEDDGIGFNTQDLPKGIGLHSVKSRVQYLGGDMELITAPGQGTSVNIHIPVS